MWCPKHRWELTNPGFTACPSCGTPLVDQLPPYERPDEPEPGREPASPEATGETITATRLGGFERLAAPMLLDLLQERGIRAFEAPQPANPATRGFDPMHIDVWVESGRLDDARRIAEEELPAFIEQSVPDEIEPEPEEASDDEIEWSSFGWMETHVATAFLAICEEEAISAHTEYPLDRPPPVWVTPGTRVQVYVDASFVDEAEQLLERLEQRLDQQGVEWVDPLCELSGP